MLPDKIEPAKIVQKPANKDVKEQTKVKFEATVKGQPKPEIEWFKNEVKIEPTDRIKMETKEVNLLWGNTRVKDTSKQVFALTPTTQQSTMNVHNPTSNFAGAR